MSTKDDVYQALEDLVEAIAGLSAREQRATMRGLDAIYHAVTYGKVEALSEAGAPDTLADRLWYWDFAEVCRTYIEANSASVTARSMKELDDEQHERWPS